MFFSEKITILWNALSGYTISQQLKYEVTNQQFSFKVEISAFLPKTCYNCCRKWLNYNKTKARMLQLSLQGALTTVNSAHISAGPNIINHHYERSKTSAFGIALAFGCTWSHGQLRCSFGTKRIRPISPNRSTPRSFESSVQVGVGKAQPKISEN